MSRVEIREKTEEHLKEHGKYYDVLDNFEQTIQKLNDKAADGEDIKCLQNRFLKLLPVFILLCGGDVTKEVKKPGPKKTKQTELPEPVPNNLKIINGWGACPKCSKKCIKMRRDTILRNYAMYCKYCKSDYIVNWQLKSDTNNDTNKI